MRSAKFTLAIAGSVIVSPVPAVAQCNSYCEVGAAGTGGLSSGGQAQGFYYRVPGRTAGRTLTNSGNSDAGRFVIAADGSVIGEITGTYRDGICRGTADGILGDFEGLDPDCDE